ncbi:hypothetical protein J7I91_15995 [Pseudomonas sp. ISL-84]|nr:hypothetical protein [Pseudomonas sp. ISL-84]
MILPPFHLYLYAFAPHYIGSTIGLRSWTESFLDFYLRPAEALLGLPISLGQTTVHPQSAKGYCHLHF